LRKAALALTLLFLLASCGGRADDLPKRPAVVATPATHLPPASPATPAFVVRLKSPAQRKQLTRAAQAEGVSEIAAIAHKELPVEGPTGRVRLNVGEVQPLHFRNVAPGPTRDADFVWTSLILGQAVPSFDAAKKLGLSGQGELNIAGTPGFQVGAIADNGVPNFVDVMLQTGAERQLRLGEATAFVIGAEPGTSTKDLKVALQDAFPGAGLKSLVHAAKIPEPDAGSSTVAAAPQVQPQGVVSGGVIGTMRFEILKDGTIRPDPAWVQANIVYATVPILGRVTCHRLLIPRLAAALGEIEAAGLADSIDPEHYGGCYVPRFVDRDASKPLSNHAFGLAIDLNTTTNQLGTAGNMDPKVIEIFRKWGFNWGGYWDRPDPMHFELAG
jgi:hypothetical protein